MENTIENANELTTEMKTRDSSFATDKVAKSLGELAENSLDKQIYEIEVAGMRLKLKSSHNDETVRQLASLVDSKVKQALDMNKNISFQNALLLAALHLAEEMTLLKQAASTRLKSLEQKTLDILTDLEDSPISRIRIDS